MSAAIELLGIGESGVGFLNAAIGAGGLLGALLAMSLLVGRSLSVSFAVSLATWGAPIAVIGLVPNPALAFVMAGVVGAANASIDVAGYTLLARSVPNEVRGRVFGVLQSLVGFGMAAGALAAPVLVQRTDLQVALIITGLILPVLALVSLRGVRRAERSAILPEREMAAMRGVPDVRPPAPDRARAAGPQPRVRLVRRRREGDHPGRAGRLLLRAPVGHGGDHP